MKKSLLFLFLVLVLTRAIAQDFSVTAYSVDIYIHPRGYFDVVEKYDLDFEVEKHGIYRSIQTSYDLLTAEGVKTKRKIRISKIEVPGYKFEAPFDFQQKLSDHIDIKIGDEAFTLRGPQHYEIRYRVHNALLFENELIRFYWNIKPDGWQANFHSIQFQLHLPDQLTPSQNDFFVYSGYSGTQDLSEDFSLGIKGSLLSGESKGEFVSGPGQSVTVLLNLPAGSLEEEKPFWPFWDQYGWTFLVVFLFGGYFALWRKFGRDEKVIATTSYYAPDGMDPAMAGFLINDKDDPSDLIALLPYWGWKGYLKIVEIPKKGWFGKKDTKLSCLKPVPANAPEYEKEMFRGLFGNTPVVAKMDADTNEVYAVTLGGGETQVHKGKIEAGAGEVLVSSLKNTFYTTMSRARSDLKNAAQQYYLAKSRRVMWITLGLLIACAVVFTMIGLFFWGIWAAVGLLFSCVFLLLFIPHMVKRNPKGNKLLSELKGFKEFIKVAEQDKLKMLLEQDPDYFENTMGYALAFGLFEKWAKKFTALHVPPPNWYQTTSSGAFNMSQFSRSFDGAISGMQSAMVSSPSQSGGGSGGGSSGGGFGGGGGGSW